MSAVWIIAANTFRENRRNRILYVLLLFAAILILAGVALSELSPFEQSKILLDMGQSMISLSGALIAIFLGISLVSREIERRTIYAVIPKPVGRTEFLLGKVLGLDLTLTAALGIMAVILMGEAFLTAWTRAEPLPRAIPLLESVALLWMEQVLLTGLAVTFASFTGTTLAAMFTVACWIIGQVSGDLKAIGDKSPSEATRLILHLLYWLLPDLSLFDAKGQATYGVALPPLQFAAAMLYGVCYTVLLLTVASLIFSRRDFK